MSRFNVRLEIATDRPAAYSVVYGDTEIYPAVSEDDADIVARALNQGLLRGLVHRMESVLNNARRNRRTA